MTTKEIKYRTPKYGTEVLLLLSVTALLSSIFVYIKINSLSIALWPLIIGILLFLMVAFEPYAIVLNSDSILIKSIIKKKCVRYSDIQAVEIGQMPQPYPKGPVPCVDIILKNHTVVKCLAFGKGVNNLKGDIKKKSNQRTHSIADSADSE